ncbi:class II glutamine amidotransferase [Streptomyces sp. NPDC085946]|uniref:class II glutamine amidotransferase n=1 Tax=Streptomyces sp. NPDC085946 TaxID=3365744 RepID=UPI0037D89A3B
MCRWLAYSGTPVLLETILYRPRHSLIDQSLHARLGVETTNGDGFGVGWYADARDGPGVIRDVSPAWNNRNLREIASHVRSPLFFAHIRASTGTAVQQTNCHPFRHGRWMWMHNGAITDFHRLRRDLALAVDPVLFSQIEGSTDSEIMFFLALTFGLDQDPPGAVARMTGLVERLGREHGVRFPLQMTVAVTDGERTWAFRHSSEGNSRSLFFSSRVETLRKLHPDVTFLQEVSDGTRLIVSEPLGDLPGAWNEVPEGSYLVVHPGTDEPGRDHLRAFTPAEP